VSTINRVAVVVEPNEPYYAWARQLDDDGPSIDDLAPEDRCSVFLIEWAEAPESTLRRHFARIFEENLRAWHRLPSEVHLQNVPSVVSRPAGGLGP